MANDAWARNGVLYRVDARLFRDGDGDGVGDIGGLASGMEYLHWLGVDGVWVTFDEAPPDPAYDGLLPVARQHAMGLADGAAWRRLTAEAHRWGLRVVIDGWAEADRVRREGGRALRDDRPGGRGGPRSDLSLRMAFDNGIDAVWAADGWAMPGPHDRPARWMQGTAPVAERTSVATSPVRIHAMFEQDALGRGARGRAAPWTTRSLALALHAIDGRRAAADSPLLLLGPVNAPRAAGFLGPELVRVAAVLLLTTPGTATVVSGDEIGLRDGDGVVRPRPYGRTGPPERAAMAWDERPGGGFASWPLAPLVSAGVEPVSRQRNDPDSLLALYRRAIALRRSERAIAEGRLTPVAVGDGLLAVLREDGGERFLVALNTTPAPVVVASLAGLTGHVALSTCRRPEGTRVAGHLRLEPYSAMVIRLGV